MSTTNYLQKIQYYQDALPQQDRLQRLLMQIKITYQAYQDKTLPPLCLSTLEVTEDDLQRLLLAPEFLSDRSWDQRTAFLRDLDHFFNDFRQEIQHEFGIWAMLNQPMMITWNQHFKKQSYLELMAGNAILSHALAEQRQKVIATDDFSWANQSSTGQNLWHPVQKLDAMSALKRYAKEVDVVLLAWSPDVDPIDWDILRYLRQLTKPPAFWVIGEYKGATNSPIFWREAHLQFDARIAAINRQYPHFDLIQDHLFIIR